MKYYNTRQVLRDVENGVLTPEEGEKILAEMDAAAEKIEHSMLNVENALENFGKGLEKGAKTMEKGLDKFARNLKDKVGG